MTQKVGKLMFCLKMQEGSAFVPEWPSSGRTGLVLGSFGGRKVMADK